MKLKEKVCCEKGFILSHGFGLSFVHAVFIYITFIIVPSERAVRAWKYLNQEHQVESGSLWRVSTVLPKLTQKTKTPKPNILKLIFSLRAN